MTDAERLAIFLLRHVDPSLGVARFHAPEVDYLCLFRSPDLTVKLYDIRQREGWLVAPHSHRYAFTEHVLRGIVRHHYFGEHEMGEAYSAYRYRTPMLGQGGRWDPLYPCGLELRGTELLTRGDAYTLDASTVHTIEVVRPALLLVFQGPDTHEGVTYFPVDREPPDVRDLYVPMKAAEVTGRCRRALERLEGTA